MVPGVSWLLCEVSNRICRGTYIDNVNDGRCNRGLAGSRRTGDANDVRFAPWRHVALVCKRGVLVPHAKRSRRVCNGNGACQIPLLQKFIFLMERRYWAGATLTSLRMVCRVRMPGRLEKRHRMFLRRFLKLNFFALENDDRWIFLALVISRTGCLSYCYGVVGHRFPAGAL